MRCTQPFQSNLKCILSPLVLPTKDTLSGVGKAICSLPYEDVEVQQDTVRNFRHSTVPRHHLSKEELTGSSHAMG